MHGAQEGVIVGLQHPLGRDDPLAFVLFLGPAFADRQGGQVVAQRHGFLDLEHQVAAILARQQGQVATRAPGVNAD